MKSIIIFGGSGYVGKNLIRGFAKKGYLEEASEPKAKVELYAYLLDLLT